ALAYDSVRVCVRGVSREGGRCRLLFLLLFLCPRAFGSFARGELASVAPSGLAPLLGLGPQLGELLLGHVFRGGEELVVLRDLGVGGRRVLRSEEHTSELQSRFDLVCRLLLEKENE